MGEAPLPLPRLSGAGSRASAQAENGPSPSGRAGVSGWGGGAGRWAAILEDTLAAVWSHLTPPLASRVSPPQCWVSPRSGQGGGGSPPTARNRRGAQGNHGPLQNYCAGDLFHCPLFFFFSPQGLAGCFLMKVEVPM